MRWFIAPALVAATLLAAACGDDGETEGDGSLSGDVTVFAAASLAEAFEEIGAAFEAANPGVSVEYNFAGSQELRTQLEQGARADVFASANLAQMDLAIGAGAVDGEPVVFARNRLVVIIPERNEAGIETLADLANPGIKIVVAGPEVPVGAYARTLLDDAAADPGFGSDFAERVLANVVSEEPNVRQVLAKVQLDEADAGIVYTSDVTADLADDVNAIEIPPGLSPVAAYPIAVTSDADDPVTAQAFIDFVLGREGQEIMSAHGFPVVDA